MTSHKGLFKPKFPHKYRGNIHTIVWRSSWELKVLMMLDHDPNVEWYSSEETFIMYHDKASGRTRRYFPDMVVKYKVPDETKILEIKPFKETQPPVNKGNQKRFIKEALTFATNTSKWEAAKRWADQRGWKFQILTEHELGIPGYGRKV